MIFVPIESAVRELSDGESAVRSGFFCTNIHLFQPLTFRTLKLAVLKPPKCELAFFPHIFLTPKCEEKTLKCEENL